MKALQSTSYIDIIGTYSSGDALIEGIIEQQPDVLLLDYHMPDQNGAQLSRYLTYHYPEVKILILTGFDKPGLSAEMLENGCMGYLLKATANTETIVDAVVRVYNGELYLDKAIQQKYANNIRKTINPDHNIPPRLSKRELEVLRGIAEELSSGEIAEKLCLSKRTVDNHRNSLMVKSGAKNTVGLIKYAIELKLL